MSVEALFNPRSIALVGATDKSGWSISTLANLRTHGFSGPVHLVNPRGGVVHGSPAFRSLTEIPAPVDLAYVMVPTGAVLGVLREGAKLGIRCYVILTAGFGESGEEGARLESEISSFAVENGLTILGPNGNGYINAAASVTPYGLPIPTPLLRGSVGVVLQSGALASSVLSFAQARNVGVSLLTSMGNETLLTVTDVVDYLVDDPSTKVIALFLETIRNPAEFSRVARRALLAGKPIVALKIGRSKLASHTAQAHTGALVGDDDVIDAALRQLGVIRVRSLEDLIITAGLLAAYGPLPGRRVGVVTPSGGASEIIADRAEDEGLELPPFAPETVARLAEIVPSFGTVQNPLDVTGYVLIDRTLLGRALEAVTSDPGIDFVMLLSDTPRVAPPDPAPALALYAANAQRITSAPVPVVVVSNVLTDVTEFGRRVQQETGFPYVAGGIEHGLHALGAAVRWSEAHARALSAPPAPPPPPVRAVAGQGVWAEHRAAALLSSAGLPVVPSELVREESDAVAAADRFGYPVVLKLAAEGLGHKSDIGGVRLGLAGPEAVRAAYQDLTAIAASLQPPATGTPDEPTGMDTDIDSPAATVPGSPDATAAGSPAPAAPSSASAGRATPSSPAGTATPSDPTNTATASTSTSRATPSGSAGTASSSDSASTARSSVPAGTARSQASASSGADSVADSVAGVLVQPQRSGGVELLVGVVRDPAWGLTLAVGLGGVWVEVLRDTALRVLPVDAGEVRRALAELRGAALLDGVRGGEPVDLDAVAEVVARIAAFAESLGDDLESLEINPLLARGSTVEALDALVTWRT
ncbi:acetate--CoA ligase family protein [Nonomuraea phyllanthi]|uniref:acetate--CoA ligase family protein n=1 Tax=Nonomuraea phyllanthi TaxID=2219224 RepID=UPI001D13E2C8|nr:acetate--CoA ligase [Nonomuraea phyllanthi]